MLRNVSLPSLRAFEAAARTGSFRAAAAELGLSPSAISHAVFALERSLGVVLFERAGRTVLLGADGEQLMRHVGAAFEELRRGVDAVTNRGPLLLRLHSAPSFAAQWLSPRLPLFLRAHQEVSVRLAASTDYPALANEDFDIDIVYGARHGVRSVALASETVTPVCTPALARAIARPSDLIDQVLIVSDRKQVRWPDWFAANDLAAPSQAAGPRFDRSFLAIAAAADGLGVALESTLLAERELTDGRLVAPLLGSARNVTYVGHHLAWSSTGLRRAPVRAFAAWLCAALGVPGPDR